MASAAVSGIFQHLWNESAFVDKAVFSIWGNRRDRVSQAVQLGHNRAIGGAKRRYGRLISGTCLLSGNPFEFKYGRLHDWANVPPFQLSVRSDSIPLSGAQVSAILDSLFRRGFRCQASLVEFTFDVAGFPFPFFREHLLTKAHTIIEVGKQGHTTLYAGKRRSPWQLRIYEKIDSMMRVEFVLRRAFLRPHGIERIDDILRLRDLDVWASASFPEFREERLAAVINKMPHSWGKNILLQQPRRRTLRFLAGVLRWRCGINPAPLLRRSQADIVLRQMQKNVLW